MKKNILKAVSVFLLAITIAGCKNSLITPENDKTTSAGNTASISVKVGNVARQIDPDYQTSITSITLTGKQDGGETKTIKTWEAKAVNGRMESAFRSLQADSVIDGLEIGAWEFTLSCNNSDGGLICSATTEKTLVAGDNGSIHFVLQTVGGNGDGNIEITLDYSSCTDSMRSVSKVEVQLKKLDGTIVDGAGAIIETPTGTWTDPNVQDPRTGIVKYTATVPNGSYIVTFTIYRTDTSETTTAAELVNVANGYTSEGTIALRDLNKSYAITYKYVYTDINDDTVTADIPNEWWASNTTIPLTFTKHDMTKTPTAMDIIRPCEEMSSYFKSYILGGWYRTSDLDESSTDPDPVTTIEDVNGDITLYAKFDDLSIAYDDYMGGGDRAYLGLEDAGLYIYFKANYSKTDFETYVTQDWYNDITWTIDDDTVLKYLDYENVPSESRATLHVKPLWSGTATVTALKNNIPIAKCEIEVPDVLTSSVYSAIALDVTEASDYSEITSFIVPEGYRKLGSSVDFSAFSGSSNIQSVELPSTMEVFYSVFSGYAKLTEVTLNATTPPTLVDPSPLADQRRYFSWGKVATIYVPASALSAYQDACKTETNNWQPSYKNTLKPFFTKVDVETDKVQSLEEYTVPDEVVKIGKNAFDGCTNLQNVVIPESVTYIDDGAFAGCTNLETITLNSTTPPTLGENVFGTNLPGTIMVPNGCRQTYIDAWGAYISDENKYIEQA